MLKAAPQILPVESHCELEAFLGYLGKTQVGLNVLEVGKFCLLLIFVFLASF